MVGPAGKQRPGAGRLCRPEARARRRGPPLLYRNPLRRESPRPGEATIGGYRRIPGRSCMKNIRPEPGPSSKRILRFIVRKTLPRATEQEMLGTFDREYDRRLLYQI